MPKISKIKCYQ